MGTGNTVPMYNGKVLKGKKILMHITTRGSPGTLMLTEKATTKGELCQDSTYMWCPGHLNPETESGAGAARGRK